MTILVKASVHLTISKIFKPARDIPGNRTYTRPSSAYSFAHPNSPNGRRDLSHFPSPLFQYTDQTYIISKKAETILSTVLADMLEESLENARSLAETAGKSSVTQREMEMSLRNLCLRLSKVPANGARFDYWNDDGDKNNKGPTASSKVGRTKKNK